MENKKVPKSLFETKYFKMIEKSFEDVGIPRQQAFEEHSINLRNSVILAILVTNIILSAIFLLFKAKTFGEFAEAVYYAVTLVTTFVIIEEFVRNSLKINQMTSNFKSTILKRKYKINKPF